MKAHRSLYQDGNILHRNISENNLIITDAEKEGQPKGILINLDLAKKLNSSPSGARQTSTIEFMAIEVLKGKAHIYRNDLELLLKLYRPIIDAFDRVITKYIEGESDEKV